MTKNDFTFTTTAAFITAAALYPTLNSADLYEKLPNAPILLFVIFPLACTVAMYIVSDLAKKLPILWQIAKFGQIGVLNTAIDFGILNLLIGLTNITSGYEIIYINAASFSIALINSYFWNKNWVFGGSKNKASFASFIIVTLIGLSINTGVVYALTTFMPPAINVSEKMWANVAKLIATILSLVWNFSGYKLVVFSTPQKLKKDK